jgi:tetratricopeptide (TPR) repeat protein
MTPMNIMKHIKPVVVKKGPIHEAQKSSDFVESDKTEYGNCIKKCSEKIRRNPRDEFAFIERGDAQVYLANPIEALTDYKRAIMINPNLIKAYYGMAAAHIMMGQHRTAMRELIKVMELEEQLDDNTLRIKALK